MERTIIYGASESGQKILHELTLSPEKQYEVIAFVDGNAALSGQSVKGINVITPDRIADLHYDKVVIASLAGKEEICRILLNTYSVPTEKIDTTYIDNFYRVRSSFLLDYASVVYDNNLSGSVAEVGVFRGGFAKYINAYFPDRTVYLFDTFKGHDQRDIDKDKEKNITGTFASDNQATYLGTSVDLVKSVLPHPEKAIFKEGYFPESAEGVDDEFVFVNLDLNLYSPTYAGLEFFYPKIVKGGVILVHDFFSWDVEPGAHIAVNKFCEKNNISYMPIGDRMSVAIVKN